MAWHAGCLRQRSPHADSCKRTTPPRFASTTTWSGPRAHSGSWSSRKSSIRPCSRHSSSRSPRMRRSRRFLAGSLLTSPLRLGQIKKDRGEALIAASWAHPLGLLMAVLISLALVAGYAGLAAFVALRVIVAAAVFGALYLLIVITQTLFATIGEQTAKGQSLA